MLDQNERTFLSKGKNYLSQSAVAKNHKIIDFGKTSFPCFTGMAQFLLGISGEISFLIKQLFEPHGSKRLWVQSADKLWLVSWGNLPRALWERGFLLKTGFSPLCSEGHKPHWPRLPSLAPWLVIWRNFRRLAVLLASSKSARIICVKVLHPS